MQVPSVPPPGFPPAPMKPPLSRHPPAPAAVSIPINNMFGGNLSSYSPLPSVFPPPPGSPASLHLRLEEASLQLQGMKKERKRVEAALARNHPGFTKLSTLKDWLAGKDTLRLPTYTSSLDTLVADSLREHSKVIALLDQMNKMQEAPQHPGIFASFKGWEEAIATLADLRRRPTKEVCQITCFIPLIHMKHPY